MKAIKLFALFLAIAVVFGACKKEETKTQKLCGKYWISTAITISPPIIVNGTPITDFFSQLDQCWKDDLQKFDENGTYTFDEGASKCSVNDPQTVLGTWSFNSGETIATVSWGGATRSYTILELSSSRLVASYTELANYGSGALNYTYTVTQVPH